MTMNEFLTLAAAPALALMAGVFFGGIFFGGLWWTVRKGVSSPRPALLFIGSLALRTSVVLSGFYFIGRGDWQRFLLCLLGFVMARLAMTWLTRPSAASPTRPAPEARRAP
jgi:F1F0 ATPase subunit 2